MSYQSRLRRLKSFIWLKRSFPFLWPRSLGKLPCLQASWQETDFPVPMGDTPAAPSQNQGAKFKVHLILDLAFLWRSQLPRHNSHCINTPWPVQVRMFPLTTKLCYLWTKATACSIAFLMWNHCLRRQQGEHHCCCYMADFFLMGSNDFSSDSLPGFHPGFVGPKAYLILAAFLKTKTHMTKLGIIVSIYLAWEITKNTDIIKFKQYTIFISSLKCPCNTIPFWFCFCFFACTLNDFVTFFMEKRERCLIFHSIWLIKICFSWLCFGEVSPNFTNLHWQCHV